MHKFRRRLWRKDSSGKTLSSLRRADSVLTLSVRQLSADGSSGEPGRCMLPGCIYCRKSLHVLVMSSFVYTYMYLYVFFSVNCLYQIVRAHAADKMSLHVLVEC